jgi:hypothetical protein
MRICVISGNFTFIPWKSFMKLGSITVMKKILMAMPTQHTNSGINHGRFELGLHLGELLEMVAHAPQDIHQRAALFAGLDHVDVKVGKNDRLLGHRLRKPLALGHIRLELAADIGESPWFPGASCC